MTCQSWLLRALFAENVWKNWHKNWLFVSGNLIPAAPDHSWSPIFGIVVPFYEFYKRYLGFSEILSFWPIFWADKVKKLTFFQKLPIFSTLRPQKWAKISKSQKTPNNVCITHQMQPSCQKWGLKNDLEPKELHFQIKKVKFFANFSIHFPEKVRVGANFVAPLHDNGESFFDSVKSFWKYISGTLKIT